MKRVAIINGPNLNLLGTREPGLYGMRTLADLEKDLRTQAKAAGIGLDTFQSNNEGDLIDAIQKSRGKADLLIVNAAAFTHTSVGIRDALLATGIPVIEVHLTNIYKRESFRHHSYLSDIAIGVISGFGPQSYALALDAAKHYLANEGAQKS